MSWLAAEKLKAKFNFKLDDQTEDEPIEFAQESAAADLEDWLAADDFALGESDTTDLSDVDKKKQKRIVGAHAYLTLYYIFLNNMQIRGSGTVSSETGGDNDGTIQYLKPKDLEELRELYLKQAKNLIAKFAIISFSETVETQVSGSDYAVYTPRIGNFACSDYLKND